MQQGSITNVTKTQVSPHGSNATDVSYVTFTLHPDFAQGLWQSCESTPMAGALPVSTQFPYVYVCVVV